MWTRIALVAGLVVAGCTSTGGSPDAGPCVPSCEGRVCGVDPECGEPCGGPCLDDSTCSDDGARCIPALPIGAACTTDLACGTNRLCLGVTSQAPGGYCTRLCDDDQPCPEGSRCDGRSGRSVCVATCANAGDCRDSEGYSCRADGVCPACVPKCANRDCGDDGCGGDCGECAEAGQACSAGRCVAGYRSLAKSLESPARWDTSAITDGAGLVWLLGGRRTVVFQTGDVGTEALSRVETFAPDALTFARGTSLPAASANVGLTRDGDNLWIASGATDPDTIGTPDGFAPKLWQLGPGIWRDFGPLPVDSRGGALLAMGGKLYYFPGETADGYSDMTRVFDPATNRWDPLPKRPIAHGWFAAATDGNRAYLLGGWDGTHTVDEVLVYDPTSGWSKAPKLKYPVALAQAAFVDERIFVFGGFDGPGTGDVRPWVQVHDLRTRRTGVVGLTHAYLSRQAPAVLRDGRVLLFGGFERAGMNPQGRNDIVQFVVPLR